MPLAEPSDAGRHDFQALAADLDDDALALAGVGRGSPVPVRGPGGDVVDEGSVSIQRVWTLKGPSAGANAGLATTARWNGKTVGMPPTTISSSARRARSSAWARVAPVTISLASMESKLPLMTSPCFDAGVHPDAGAGGIAQRVDRAGGRHEVPARVLAGDAEFERVAADFGVAVAELLAAGQPELFADQVDPGDFFGDAVLHLQAGVDLEEGDGAVLADQEFAGAGAQVAGLARMALDDA